VSDGVIDIRFVSKTKAAKIRAIKIYLAKDPDGKKRRGVRLKAERAPS